MREPRGARVVDWYWLMLVAVVLLALLVALWPEPASPEVSRPPQVPSPGGTATALPEPRPSTVGGTSPQPDLSGYEYRVSTERYLVRRQDGQLEVQDRRRESWRSADGWAWARQTGSDPGRFIFGPTDEWRAITAAAPTVAAQQRVLRARVQTAKTSDDITRAEFAFVDDLLGTESLPDSAVPTNYRSALIGALATNSRVRTTRHVDDPAGRDSTRVSWTSGSLMMSLYLDREGNLLGSTQVAKDTGERGSRVITSRHRTKNIPQDLLRQLGSERVEKAFWS